MFSSEQTAVLEVIQAEFRAFWMKDAAAFEAFHLKEDVSLRWGFLAGGGPFIRRGWKEIGPRSLTHMQQLPRPVPEFADAPLSNLVLRVSSDIAWASFEKNHPPLPDLHGHGPNGVTHNLRILEKHHGKWLIAVSALLDSALGDDCVVRVGRDALILWKSPAGTQGLPADEHFIEISGRLRLRKHRINSRFDSVLDWALSQDDHFMPQATAIPFHLDSETGVPRIVWIIGDMGSALVFLEDRRTVDQRVAVASQAFGFSPAQRRLALALAQGVDLERYAADNSVSPNTARTHLKRMFEKTYVSSQLGLLRLLLSFSPPRR